jgi:hypothetical protein
MAQAWRETGFDIVVLKRSIEVDLFQCPAALHGVGPIYLIARYFSKNSKAGQRFNK